MNPGRLKDKITLQKKLETVGPVQLLDEYEDYKTIWAETRYLTGRNFYAARAANVKVDVEFIIRHRNDLDETMRIKFKDKLYNIEGVLPLGNTRALMCIRAYEVKHDM
jgi:SPP1 family predicted phage head-tail adaptor